MEFEHPSAKEGFTDKLYRYVNEMVCIHFEVYISLQDFEGQKLADSLTRNTMLLCAVSILSLVMVDGWIRVNSNYDI